MNKFSNCAFTATTSSYNSDTHTWFNQITKVINYISVPANVGGFIVREAGVFDRENNLIVISKIPETVKQDPNNGTIKQLTIRIELKLSNKELAELVINPNMQMVTKDELNKITENIDTTFQKISEKGEPDGYAPIGQDGLIPLEFIPEIETKSTLTPFCLNACQLDTNGNPDLLSSETVKVLKYTSSVLGVFYTDLNTILDKDIAVQGILYFLEYLIIFILKVSASLVASFSVLNLTACSILTNARAINLPPSSLHCLV